MRYERWFRLAAAASVLLLLLAGGAVAAQLRATQEVRRLKDRLAALERQARDTAMRRGEPVPSPVAIVRVTVVDDEVSTAAGAAAAGATAPASRTTPAGRAMTQAPPAARRATTQASPAARPGTTAASPAARTTAQVPPAPQARPTVQGNFAVQATVTNGTARTLRQPVIGMLILSDPNHPEKPAEIQWRQAVIDTLAPGDTTTVRLEGFEAREPALRHELLVSIPAVAPEQPGGTVVKVVPRVVRAPGRAARPTPQAPAARPPAAPAKPVSPSPPPPTPGPATPQPTPPAPSQPAPPAPSQPAPPAPSQPTAPGPSQPGPAGPSQPTTPGAAPSQPSPQAPPPPSSQPGATPPGQGAPEPSGPPNPAPAEPPVPPG